MLKAIKKTAQGVRLVHGKPVLSRDAAAGSRSGTIAYQILEAHHKETGDDLFHITFDALVSHDITYVGIIQSARASGMTSFPVPYALTNCHNSLCAVGGTINEDDHAFGLSAARKYGGIYVPANQSVIHSFAREELSGCGRMILGSDSHTRYGALGTMGVGEGGPELVKQLLKNTYDIAKPEVVLVYVTGKVPHGVGPHDVAIALVGETFKDGFVKNKILEFAGPGIASLPIDFRNGIDVMTTETTCLSSVWQTDETVRSFYETHGRPEAYRKLEAREGAYYDALIELDLSKMECMIALPFHPSNAYTIHEFNEHAEEILEKVQKEAQERFPKSSPDLMSKITEKGVMADQGVIAGCSGGMYDSIREASAILDGQNTGNGYFSLSVYPTSVPVSLALTRDGTSEKLLEAGAVIKPSFCGPCFGAGDVPANNGLSLRHTTRNFPSREGSKPGEGQFSCVALMDARSIAATARNQGIITAASDVDYTYEEKPYTYDRSVYEKRVYNGFGHPQPDEKLILGPNITDWPEQYPLSEHLFLELAAVIQDPVTTTDELIPSGETSSYRSNPRRLAEFTLSRRVPDYVQRAKAASETEKQRRENNPSDDLVAKLNVFGDSSKFIRDTMVGSCIFARKPGDGSAREQAASCQKVLGGLGNIAYEYATKRYRSNLINWGILPFTLDSDTPFDYAQGDCIFVPHIRTAVIEKQADIPAIVLTQDGSQRKIMLHLTNLTDDEREIILDGCLMNYNRKRVSKNG
ncbi:MAG: hydratase [Clostridia bacterium]|nr:hydratase [Clostridia bacterium]